MVDFILKTNFIYNLRVFLCNFAWILLGVLASKHVPHISGRKLSSFHPECEGDLQLEYIFSILPRLGKVYFTLVVFSDYVNALEIILNVIYAVKFHDVLS